MSDYKPITGELRKYATVSWDPWPDARDRLYQMCDRIDAIHAGLERENAELKAKLDRVTGEQEERKHSIGEVTVTVTPTLDWSAVALELHSLACHLAGEAE